MPDSIGRPDYAVDGIPISEQRSVGKQNIKILDAKEQDSMRRVCRLAREVLDTAAAEVKPGVTTDYLDEVVHKACVERNVGPSPQDFATLRQPKNMANMGSHIHPR